jgi:glycosyltransferase involved in cell wall biosynthesis
MTVQVFVPRWMDRTDTNAQNSNARALLSRFADPRARWTAISSQEQAPQLTPEVLSTRRISGSRWWQWELARAYQSDFNAVFYPGPHWSDQAGLRLRALRGKHTPVIATLEGVIATPESVRKLSALVGHAVFSQPNTEQAVPRIKWMYERADHIIAVSPFLARVAAFLYGEKVSCLPLGLEGSIFHSAGREEPARCRVVTCGTIKNSKNPQLFLGVAARYADADFVWFGNGEMIDRLRAEVKQKGLANARFPGALQPPALAEEFRKSSMFVLPSRSEGVPKVTQEAAACGLPVVLHGFFEAPTVVHGQNGLVAWSDEEFTEQVGALIHDRETRMKMGQRGAKMAEEWDWDRIAPQWEDLVIQCARG